MDAKPADPRIAEWDVDGMFTDRWSPRAFSSDPLTERDVHALIEAARWAPSCYNEQPWQFVYAVAPRERERMAECLVPKNRAWALRAPLLMFLLTRRRFGRTGKENRHAAHDAGAAWMALALQARKLGLYAHAMAGFNPDAAYALLGVARDEVDILTAIAVGRLGDPSGLPDDLRAMEAPNGRKPHADVAVSLATLAERNRRVKTITVEHHPDPGRLKALGVPDWPIWTKEASEFPWSYDDASETCYFLKGEVTVTPDGGEPVAIAAGDLVTFPRGMSCTWKIRKDVKKHYRFE